MVKHLKVPNCQATNKEPEGDQRYNFNYLKKNNNMFLSQNQPKKKILNYFYFVNRKKTQIMINKVLRMEKMMAFNNY